LRGPSHPKALPQSSLEKTRGVLETLTSLFKKVLFDSNALSVSAEVNLCNAKIRGYFYAGENDFLCPGILHLAQNQICQLILNEIGNARRSRVLIASGHGKKHFQKNSIS
jgi:hypothetical protein